jgi:hypothetical protein
MKAREWRTGREGREGEGREGEGREGEEEGEEGMEVIKFFSSVEIYLFPRRRERREGGRKEIIFKFFRSPERIIPLCNKFCRRA